jgi:hypothetical protein
MIVNPEALVQSITLDDNESVALVKNDIKYQ